MTSRQLQSHQTDYSLNRQSRWGWAAPSKPSCRCFLKVRVWNYCPSRPKSSVGCKGLLRDCSQARSPTPLNERLLKGSRKHKLFFDDNCLLTPCALTLEPLSPDLNPGQLTNCYRIWPSDLPEYSLACYCDLECQTCWIWGELISRLHLRVLKMSFNKENKTTSLCICGCLGQDSKNLRNVLEIWLKPAPWPSTAVWNRHLFKMDGSGGSDLILCQIWTSRDIQWWFVAN